MTVLSPLDGAYRALRTLQAPEQVVFDHGDKIWRPSTSAFKQQSDGTISVDLEEVLIRDGHPLTFCYPRVDRAVGLVAHTVERLTNEGFAVTHEPIPDNDYHGEARGKPSRTSRNSLASTCEIVVPIQGDDAQRHLDAKLAKQALAEELVGNPSQAG